MERGKRLFEVSKVERTEDGVVVRVVEKGVMKEKIEEIVNNCKTGQCSCISEETKRKVSSIDVKILGGKPAIEIRGDVSKEEIEEAVLKSDKIVG